MAKAAKSTENQEPNFIIQKVFTKDISLESPNAPSMFKSQWEPQADVSLDTQSNELGKNTYEVDLTLTVTVKNSDQTAYLIEVTQSGIFTMENMPKEQIDPTLGAFCPTTLFPYAKETIDSLINRAGFPQINLAPINFDAIYMQKAAQQKKATAEKTKH